MPNLSDLCDSQVNDPENASQAASGGAATEDACWWVVVHGLECELFVQLFFFLHLPLLLLFWLRTKGLRLWQKSFTASAELRLQATLPRRCITPALARREQEILFSFLRTRLFPSSPRRKQLLPLSLSLRALLFGAAVAISVPYQSFGSQRRRARHLFPTSKLPFRTPFSPYPKLFQSFRSQLPKVPQSEAFASLMPLKIRPLSDKWANIYHARVKRRIRSLYNTCSKAFPLHSSSILYHVLLLHPQSVYYFTSRVYHNTNV